MRACGKMPMAGSRPLLSLVGVFAVLACTLAAPTTASADGCTASVDAPQGPLPGKVVAPNLRVVRSFGFGASSCGALRISGRSAGGTLWAWDNGNRLWRSADDGTTWTLAYTATGYAQLEGVLALSSGRLLVMARDPGGLYHVLRSTDASGTEFEPTPVLDMRAGTRLLGSQSWLERDGAVYIGEYGDATEPIKLWKSTDGGASFSTVHDFYGIRHIHSVQADPYVDGRLWVSIGDNGTAPRVGYSDDGGSTWTFITQGRYPESRVVALMFDRDAVYWGTDAPELPGVLYRWDRQSGQITQVLTGANGPFYFAFQHDGIMVQFSGVATVGEGYIGDQFFHVLSSNGGTDWSQSKTPFMREPASDPGSNAVILGSTEPDPQGRFWVNFWNLEGTQARTSNVQFQIDPTADYGGVNAAFAATPTLTRANQDVAFDGSASSSPNGLTAHSWSWGDGTANGSGATATHRYGANGSHLARLQVTDANGDIAETTRRISISSSPTAPGAVTGLPSAVAGQGATLAGHATANGAATTVRFEYGTTTAYGSQTPGRAGGSGTGYLPHTADVAGLAYDTTYHYRLVATNAAGTTRGADRVLRTGRAPPSAATDVADAVADRAATLRATVNPNGTATTVRFEYGLTTAYGAATPDQDAGAGSAPQSLAAALDALQPLTTYHYRVVATSPAGTTYGEDRTLTTDAPPPVLPAVTTDPAASVTGSAADLQGTVHPNGLATTAHFEYGRTTGYGRRTADQPVSALDAVSPVTAPATGLAGTTTYHYRLVATSAAGTSHGPDRTFTTLAGPPGAETDPATGVTIDAATLNGTADPQRRASTVRFEYGTTTAYGAETPIESLPGNLAANPSFEAGMGGWSTAGSLAPATFAREAGWASDGAAAARFTTAELPPGGYSEMRTEPYVTGVQAGGAYDLRATVNVLSLAPGQKVLLYVTWRSATGSSLGKLEVTRTTTAGIQTLAGSKVAPVGTVAAQVVVTVENAGTADLHVDDVRMLAAGTGGVQPVSAPVAGLDPDTTYHFRVVVSNDLGTSYGEDRTLTTDPLPVAPSASTSAATALTHEGATLNGSVNPNGHATTYRFEYRPVGASDWTSLADQSAGGGDSARSVNADLDALASDSAYEFRLVAVSDGGTTTSSPPEAFATDAEPVPPSASTAAATFVTTAAATLNGSVNPNGRATSYRFEHRAAGASAWTATADQSAGSGTAAQAVSAAVSGLAASTAYEFRLVAANSVGTTTSSPPQAFTTATPPPVVKAPTATTSSASALTGAGATLNGSVNPGGGTTSVRYQYGTTTSYGAQTAAQSLTGTTAQAVPRPVSGLLPNTLYHFRVLASNSAGSTTGSDLSFRTLAIAPAVANAMPTVASKNRITLRGTVDPNGSSTTYRFQWGTTTRYGNQTSQQSAGSGQSPVSVSALTSSLSSGVVYHGRLVATNAAGTSASADVAFTRNGPVAGTSALRDAGPGLLAMPAACPGTGTCAGELSVSSRPPAGSPVRARVVARLRFRAPAGSRRTVRIRLRATQRALLGSPGSRVLVTATLRVRDAFGATRRARRSLFVRL